MRPPKWLFILGAIFLLFCAIGLILKFTIKLDIIEDLGSVALVITLIVVIFYTHYTSVLANVAWAPSA